MSNQHDDTLPETPGSATAHPGSERERDEDIAAATLDRPEVVAPGFHIFCGDAIRWALLDDGLPRHEQFRPDTRGLSRR